MFGVNFLDRIGDGRRDRDTYGGLNHNNPFLGGRGWGGGSVVCNRNAPLRGGCGWVGCSIVSNSNSPSRSLIHPRQELVETIDRIYRYRMTTTSGGNLSIRDENGDVWITPARIDKGLLRPDDVV